MSQLGPVDTSRLTPVNQLVGEDEDETKELQALYRNADKYITSFKWCSKVSRAWLGYGIGAVIGVFYFEIESAFPEVDNSLWVIVGDLPSVYLVTDDAICPRSAVSIYLKLYREWIAAVKSASSVEDLPPANVAPTLENAGLLETRLDFIEKRILPTMEQ